jgi:hypothetical protein
MHIVAQRIRAFELRPFLLAVLLSSVSAAHAQVSVGLSGGWAMASVGGDEGTSDTDLNEDLNDTDADEGRGARQGFYAGLDVNYTLPAGLVFGSGLRFHAKGFRADNNNEDNDFSSTGDTQETLNVSYLEIPLLLGYRLAASEAFSMVIAGGPYAAFAVAQSYQVEDENGTELIVDDELKMMKGFDFGLEIQARFMASLSAADSLGLQVAYSFGLANAANEAELEDELGLYDYEASNRSFMLGLAYEHAF